MDVLFACRRIDPGKYNGQDLSTADLNSPGDYFNTKRVHFTVQVFKWWNGIEGF